MPPPVPVAAIFPEMVQFSKVVCALIKAAPPDSAAALLINVQL
ncbi:MAG: hypothetical protein BWY82_02069 [Verrucomicrobia bacterium ADurb.Bin474]|nr:MAG: hypothetical protein BWY82_02069 [Verrucomicrobia bacterium ADurb.Bin474]